MHQALIIFMVAAQYLDWQATIIIMRLGGLEANPVMAYLFNVNMFAPLLVKLAFAAALAAWAWNKGDNKTARASVLCVSGLYAMLLVYQAALLIGASYAA